MEYCCLDLWNWHEKGFLKEENGKFWIDSSIEDDTMFKMKHCCFCGAKL
jgi:hypothetical protein